MIGLFRVILTLATVVAVSGCTLGGSERTYAVSTARGEVQVTCEWFAHDGGYWEPTAEETYEFQWVCDRISDFGWAPRTIANPTDPTEVARRR